MKTFTTTDVIQAFVDVLDGNHNWYDIRANTGLSEKRCKEIESIWCAAIEGKLHLRKPQGSKKIGGNTE